jgi:hypothetical protein
LVVVVRSKLFCFELLLYSQVRVESIENEHEHVDYALSFPDDNRLILRIFTWKVLGDLEFGFCFLMRKMVMMDGELLEGVRLLRE